MLQFIIHYTLHFLFPGLIAWVFFRNHWKKAWLIMIATMLVDVDHLLASPKFRIVSIGLLFHMLTDFIDCLLMK